MLRLLRVPDVHLLECVVVEGLTGFQLMATSRGATITRRPATTLVDRGDRSEGAGGPNGQLSGDDVSSDPRVIRAVMVRYGELQERLDEELVGAGGR